MKTHEKVKKQKEEGITLIALIITIIILITLAAVAIKAIAEDNFVGLAMKGTENYAKAQNEEISQMEDLDSMIKEELVKLENGTPGKSWDIFDETKTINGETEGSYNPAIPKGFKPVNTEGANWGDGTKAPNKADVQNGLVIEDKDGNQFVWVPCSTTGAEGVTKYAKHKYEQTEEQKNDAGKIQRGTDGWTTYHYRNYTDWVDSADSYGNTSVTKHGGFYVGRYEAGIPEDAPFYPKEENNYLYTQQRKEGVWQEGTSRNVNTYKPVSKRNVPAWSQISQENAFKVSEAMYADNNEVQSKLIDGTAWDTIVEWIDRDDVTVTDSKTVGNYYSSEGTINGMHITHTTNNGKWTTGQNYVNGEVSQPRGIGTERQEIYTGILNNTKLKNIYDMAGNMWELTTETYRDKSKAVMRGGSFEFSGRADPLCERNGTGTVNTGATSFRIPCRALLTLVQSDNHVK